VEDKENAELDITIGTLKIDLRDFLAISKDEIFFNAKNKKIPLENQEISKKQQFAKVTVKSKRGFAGQDHFDSDHNFDFSDASHDVSEMSETSGGSISGNGSLSGDIKTFSQDDSDSSDSNKILELQLETESLKRQYRTLVTKQEKEKREWERLRKNKTKEKKKK